MNWRWTRRLAAGAAAGGLLMLGVPGVAASAAAVSRSPGVAVCGRGPSVTRPSSMILTCADDGTIAEHLTWTSWSARRATAHGIVTWRSGARDFAKSTDWDQTPADLVLTRPATERGHRILFTRLELHVTGATPKGFLRDLTFDEAPAATPPAARPADRTGRRASPLAASGTLSYADIEGFWIDAGGPTNSSGSFTDPQIAAAITGAESSFLPGNIQQGVDYCGGGSDRAGWGLWQITCGNAVPAYGTDFQLLDPWNNAEAAVFDCRNDAAAGANCFDPWTTYLTGAYTGYLQSTAPNTQLTDPGEYVQFAPTPPGTPSSPAPDPGSTFGPPMPGSGPPPPSAVSPLSEDSAGQTVAFVNSSGRLVNDYYVAGWHGPGALPGTPRADSPVAISPDGQAVYFIQSNGQVVNDYYTSAGWQGPGATGGTAAPGSGLAFFPGSASAGTGPAVVFVASSGALVNDYYVSGWKGPGVLPGAPRAGSPLLWNSTGTGVFFIASNGAVVNDYHNSTGWHGPSATGGTAAAGSGLAFTAGSSSAGTGLAVAFIASSGALVNDYDVSGWKGPGVLPGTPRAGSPLWWNATGTGVFFIASSGAVVNDYHDSAGWHGPGATGGTAAKGSALTYAPGNGTTSGPNLMFIDSSGVLVNDWYAGNWQGPGPLPGTPK